jgi:hypothetical protein
MRRWFNMHEKNPPQGRCQFLYPMKTPQEKNKSHSKTSHDPTIRLQTPLGDHFKPMIEGSIRPSPEKDFGTSSPS